MKNKQNKNLNLENVQELTLEEAKNINGGVIVSFWGGLLRAMLGVGAAYVVHECTC